MFSYQVIQKPDDLNIDVEIIKKILKNIDDTIDKLQNGILNIVFVDDEEIQRLNRDYRNIDKVTDVLSFHYYDDFGVISSDEVAWEVILSINKIISQWEEFWLWTLWEFYKLFIHSTLHILGYDHILDSDYRVMQPLEDQIWNKTFDK